MKKAGLLLLCIFTGSIVYAQNLTTSQLIDRCMNLLGKPVTSDFRRLDRTTYENAKGILALVENGLVSSTMIGRASDTTREAASFTVPFYNFFEDNNFDYCGEGSSGTDIYLKNGIYIAIKKSEKREDGKIISGVWFSKNKEDFD